MRLTFSIFISSGRTPSASEARIIKGQIIKGHNKKVVQIKRHHQLECNCRIKAEFPLNGDCWKGDVIYRCTSSTTLQPKNVNLGL